MKRLVSLAAVFIFTFCQIAPLHADQGADMMAMLESMKQQMSTMQETINAQNLRIQQLESSRALETPQANVPMPSTAATMSDADFEKGIKDNIGKAVPWLKGTKFGGDFRLRFEGFNFYDKDNNDRAASAGLDADRNRFRIRLRWGGEKDFGDDWKVGFRLATGSTTDNTSTNSTLGNPGYFNFKTIVIDRAFAQYSPNGLKDYGPIKGVTIGGGKFENPFLRYSTSMMWDGDVTPEGAYEKVNLQIMSTEENKLNLYTTFGQFIINENNLDMKNANMFGYQGALHWSTYNLNTDRPVELTGAVSYYDFTNWSQTVLASGNTAATSYLRTNSLYADSFRVLDIYPELVFYKDNVPVTLWYDYAKNVGNAGTDDPAALNRTIHDKDDGWGFGVKLGKAKEKGSWEGFYGYYEIGANAVPAAFNDSDFGGPGTHGFTNRKGHKFGLSYQLTENAAVNWTNYIVRPLNVTNILSNSTSEKVFRTQLDLVFKF